jgi:hypothetical protein
MRRSAISRVAGITAAAVILSACGANGNGAAVPGAGSATQEASNRIGDASGPNLSGVYSGPADDNVWGKGTGTMFYAQSGNAIGGVFTLKLKKNTLYLDAVQTVSGTTVHGSNVSGSQSVYCTTSTSAKYDAKTSVVSGSYTAVYGCAYPHEKGTFSLKQRCYFKGSGNADIRPEAGSIKPC